MGGGGKSQTSTQQVSIPPEVLARYNAVNARAEDVATRPFQQYGTTAEAFVAPLTQTQQQGIAQTAQYGQAAQPYFGAATNQLMAAQQAGQAGLGAAYPTLAGAQQVGQQLGNEAYGAYQTIPQAFLPSYMQAQQGIQQGLGAGQALLGGATGYALAGAQPINAQQFSGQAVNQYMSPFIGNVVQQTMAAQAQQNAQQRNALTGEAIRAGAFGGDRAGIAQANLAYQQNLANQQTLANLLQGGYGQALGAFQQQQGVNLAAEQANRAALQQTGQGLAGLGQQAYGMGTGAAGQQAALGQALAGIYGQQATGLAGLGQQQFGQGATTAQQQAALAQQGYGMGAGTAQALAGLGQGAQAAGLQGAQAMLGAGQIEQQTDQAGKQALYNQFLQQQGYPFQVAQFLANIAMGTGALSGSTTTTTQPSPFFSDRKVKENVRKIGETEKGLPIYKFRYKGEEKDQTHIGYMADDVEKKHPDAVGEYGGVKTVDYNKVNARESMGGAVHEGGLSRGAYALGGNSPVDANDLQALIAQQRQMYGPHGMGGLYGGSAQGMPRGGQSPVPSGGLHVPRLVTAGGLPKQQQGGFEQAMAAAEKAQGYAEKLIGKYDPKTQTHVGGIKDKWDQAKQALKNFTSSDTSNQSSTSAGAPAPAQVEKSDNTLPENYKTSDVYRATGGLIPRYHYAEGGEAAEDTAAPEGIYKPVAEGINIPDDNSQKRELAKPGEAPGGGGKKGPSGASMALKAAGTLANLIPGVGPFIGTGMNMASSFFNEGGVVPRQGYQQAGAVPEDQEDYFEKRIIPIESGGRHFDKTGRPLTSSAGAIGIAQVMPGTAPEAAKLAGVPFDDNLYRNDEQYNKSLGRAYYNAQVEKFGDPVLAAAAYNAGPGNVQKALAKAQQTGGNYVDYLPAETQAYVQKFSRGEIGPSGGLGGGKQVASAQAQPSGGLAEKAQGLGDFLTSSKFLVPFGTGLAAMASSPSIRPGGAILTGIGAGLAASQTPDLVEAQTQKIKEETSGIQQANVQKSVQELKDGTRIIWLKGGKFMYADEYEDAKRRGENPELLGYKPANGEQLYAEQKGQSAAGQTTGTGGAGLPSKPTTIAGINVPLSNEAIQAARDERSIVLRGGPNAEAVKKASMDWARPTQTQGSNARASINGVANIAENISKNAGNKGFETMGFGADLRAQYMSFANTVLRSLGKDPINNLDEASQMQYKLGLVQAELQAAGGGQTSYAAMNDILGAQPNLNMDPKAATKLSADLWVARQRQIDKDNFRIIYGKNSDNNFSQADAWFNESYSMEQYQRELNAIQNLLMKDPDLLKELRSGKFTAAQIDKGFEKSLGQSFPGISRYFVSGRTTGRRG